MAATIFTIAKSQILSGDLDFNAHDIRVMLVMTNNNLSAKAQAPSINWLDATSNATLDEFDGSQYTAGGKALANEAVASDTANARGEFDASDVKWTSLGSGGAGTRNIKGVLVYKFLTNRTNASTIPIAYVTNGFGASGIPANGGDFTIQWNAEGIVQAT